MGMNQSSAASQLCNFKCPNLFEQMSAVSPKQALCGEGWHAAGALGGGE